MKIGKVGLIAGGGSLPVEFLKAAKKHGIKTVVFGIKGETGNEARVLADTFHEVKITGLSGIIKLALKENVNKVVFLGYVRHTNIFKNISFDFRTVKVLASLPNLSADSIMKGIFKELASEGISVLPSTFLMDNSLAKKGLIAGRKPSLKELKDIKFGFKMARGLAALDIGQTIVVKNGVIAAAEAQEGTDAAIERGAKIAGPGFIVVKAARPGQDLRYDVPVIGAKTLEILLKYKGAGIAVESGKTFVLDREVMAKEAGKKAFIYGL